MAPTIWWSGPAFPSDSVVPYRCMRAAEDILCNCFCLYRYQQGRGPAGEGSSTCRSCLGGSMRVPRLIGQTLCSCGYD